MKFAREVRYAMLRDMMVRSYRNSCLLANRAGEGGGGDLRFVSHPGAA